MAPAPVVTVYDPCGHVDTAFSGTVIVTATPSFSTTNPVTAVATGGRVAVMAGVATFRALSFADYGYRETLTFATTGITSIVSADFDIVQSLVACAAGTTCTTPTLSDKAGTTLASITADPGPQADLTATVKGDPAGQYGSCGQPATGTTEQALGSVVTFNVTSRTKTVTMTLPRAYVNSIPNNGTPFMDICLDVPAPGFTDKFGKTNTPTGLLPDCGSPRVAPCITSRGKRAGDELITFILPAGDPHSSWY